MSTKRGRRSCGGDGDDPVSIADLCSESNGAFQKLIQKQLDCNPELIEVFFNGIDLSITQADCETAFEGFIENGTAVFGSREAVSTCTTAIESASCDTFNIDGFDACDDVMQGTVALGGECEDDLQCEGDSFCDESGSGCGVCVTRAPDGASCTDNDECSSQYCDGSECRAKNDAGGACTEDDDCAGRLVCNSTTAECQRAEEWSAGDSCMTDTDDCATVITALWCCTSDAANFGACDAGDANTCINFLTEGDDCLVGFQCNPFAGLHCDTGVTDKCIQATPVGEGTSCAFDSGNVCSSGLFCDFSDNSTCRAPFEAGDSCSQNDGDSCPGSILLTCNGGTCQVGDFEGVCPAP